MHVLFVTGEYPPMQGGVGDCTHEIARALVNCGAQVSVLTSATESPVPAPQSTSLAVLRAVKKWDWSALPILRETLAATRADILHIQYQTAAFGMHPMINFAPRLLQRAARSPAQNGASRRAQIVVTFHDLLPMYLFPKAGRVRDWVTFQLARSSDAVIATNEDDYIQLAAVNLKLLTLTPIGSNLETTPPPDFDRAVLRAQLGVEPDEILLCYFGFLNDSKGGETLIRALPHLPNAKLVLLGGQLGASDPTNAAYLARVKQLIGELGLTPRVIWTDFMPQPRVSAHFLAADVCVLPYRNGASYRRGTLMAALAHGMAIVTTRAEESGQKAEGRRQNSSFVLRPPSSVLRPWSVVGQPPTLPQLENEENALLVPPDDPTAIADAVKRIAASPALKARLQSGARATAAFFTWDKIADAHLELYERLLNPT